MFKKVIMTCLLFGASQAHASIQTFDFNVEPIKYESRGNIFATMLETSKAYHENENLALEVRQKQLEIQIMEEQLRSLRNAESYNHIKAKAGRPKTVHVRGYHRKNGTYVRSHYRSPPTKKTSNSKG